MRVPAILCKVQRLFVSFFRLDIVFVHHQLIPGYLYFMHNATAKPSLWQSRVSIANKGVNWLKSCIWALFVFGGRSVVFGGGVVVHL